jgi:hypothetical protein
MRKMHMKYEVFDSLSWLFSDSIPGEKPLRSALLIAPRGGRPGFQVLLDRVPPGTKVRFDSDGLSGDGGLRIRGISCNLLHSVPVEYNTGKDGFTARNRPAAKGVSRKAPFRCFDVIEPITENTYIWENDPPAFYVSLDVPRSAQPGHYSGRIEITVNESSVKIPVKLEVAAVRLPSRSALSLTTWFSTDPMAYYHGLAPWSLAHLRMIRKYANLMAAYHQDTFRVPLNLVIIEKTADREWSFNFKPLEPLMHTMIDAGMTSIEGGHLGGCIRWGMPEMYIGVSEEMRERRVRLSSTEAQAFYARFLPAWRSFLVKRGWYGMLCQHIADEPTEGALCDYTAAACAVRKYLPGIPIIDAVELPHLGAGVDWWVPKIDHYERDRADYEMHRSHGDRIWCYTCCKPGGRFMNRLLDFPLLRTRLLAWGCAKYDISGYLHWALNSWDRDRSPFEHSVKVKATREPDGARNDIPAGDKHIIYPGSDGPWSSMRFEAQREGWEDHALLMAARKQLSNERFDTLVSRTVRSFSDFTDDPALFRRQYRALIRLISK